MIKTAALLGLLLFGAAPAFACPAAPDDAPLRLLWTTTLGEEGTLLDAGVDSVHEGAALRAAYAVQERATACALRAWMQSLASGFLALLTVALAAAGLLRLAHRRRSLASTALTRRPVPAAVVLSLLSPVVPPLVLMHAEREILPSPVLLLATAGAVLALAMLLGRRQLIERLRAAAKGPLRAQEEGALALAEVEPKQLLTPPGARGRVPWFEADLSVAAAGELARVGLTDAEVDDGTAHLLSRLANGGGAAGARLTVLGSLSRVPADAGSADPLCRQAPMMARMGGSPATPALITLGTPAELLQRLQLESVLLGILCLVCAGSATLAYFN